MRPKAFRTALRAMMREPFHPFVVALHNGQRFEITHPEGLRVEGGVIVAHEDDRTVHRFDSSSVVSMFIPFGRPEDREDIPE